MPTRLFFALVLLPLLGACTSLYTPRNVPAPVEEVGGGAPPAPSTGDAPPVFGPPVLPPRDSGSGDVVVNPAVLPPVPEREEPATPLDADIRLAMDAGEYDRAAALTERALRIRPRDASLWLGLSRIRLAQARPEDARGHAQRALSFSTNTAQRREIEQLLSRIAALP